MIKFVLGHVLVHVQQRIKMGFKRKEWEGRIELEQVEGREKLHKLRQS